MRRNVREFIYRLAMLSIERYLLNVIAFGTNPGGVGESRRLSIGSNFRRGAEGRPEKFTHVGMIRAGGDGRSFLYEYRRNCDAED